MTGSQQRKHSLHVLMLDNEYPPLGGGTGIVNQRILEEWALLGNVEVDLVTSSRTRDQYEHHELTPAIHIHKVPVNNKNIHHSSNGELLAYAWRGWLYSRRLAKRSSYDVCLAFAGVPAGAIAMWLKWEFGFPYIVSLQGPDVPGFEKRYRWVHLVLGPLIQAVWHRASALSACSEQHRELAQKTNSGLQVQAISNGVNTSIFRPNPALRRNDGIVRLICAGRLIGRKGQQFLIPAVAELRNRGCNVELLIVGTGDSEIKLRRQAEKEKLENSVRFAGFVNWHEMPRLYQSSDIFVLPSYNEGMSIALLEAMASGLPVVVTETGGVRELLKGNGIIIPWANVGELVRALEHMIASPELREKMSITSREIAKQFGWDKVAQRYLQLCEETAKI